MKHDLHVLLLNSAFWTHGGTFFCQGYIGTIKDDQLATTN